MIENTPYIDRVIEEETKLLIRLEQLKKNAYIDRSETCFIKGKIYSKSLTPLPEDAKRLRTQQNW